MDTRMIDVAIGLVLVFAISSLAVTTLHEIWISFGINKSRGNTWLIALCSLLGDNDVSIGRWRRGMLRRPGPSEFTRQLLQQPLMQSQVLGKAANGKTPSYLDADVFVSSLVAETCKRYAPGAGRPDTPQEWVSTLASGSAAARMRGAAAPNVDLVQALQALLPGAEKDWLSYEKRICAWYDSVMKRSEGWFKRDTQLRLFVIGYLVAALGNINPVVVVPRLWNDGVARAAMVGAAEKASDAYGKELATAAPAASAAATAAWVATPVAATVAAQRLTSPRSLEVDFALRDYKETLFRSAQTQKQHALGEPTLKVEDAVARLLDLERQIAERRKSVAASTYPQPTFDASEIIEDHLTAMKAPLAKVGHQDALGMLERLENALIAERARQLPEVPGRAAPRGACQTLEDENTRKLCQQMSDLEALAGSGLPIGWDWVNWPLCDAACIDRKTPGGRSQAVDRYKKQLADDTVAARKLRLAYEQAQAETQTERARRTLFAQADHDLAWGLLLALPGWGLTALAVMLGAPFWFDLLGKLVKLRASTRSETGGDKGTAPPGSEARSTLTTAPTGGGDNKAPVASPAALAPAPLAPIIAPLQPAVRARTPVRTNGTICPLSDLEVRRLYGDIETVPDATRSPGDPGWVLVTKDGQPGQAQRELVPYLHASLNTKRGTAGMQVHKLAKPHFDAVFTAIAAQNLAHLINTIDGTLATRHIGRDVLRPLSHHCWGIAIDINAAQNGYGQSPAAIGLPGSVRELVSIFAQHGFAWGGDFSGEPDGMHFELALRTP